MGHNDHADDSELDNLPAEAWGPSEVFDPDDRWIEKAKKDDQLIAMREWFLARYQDPAFGTPFNDGDYYFVDGGPYDPADVLSERFGSIVEDETIQELISELHSEVGDEWAPSMRDQQDEVFAFDERLEISPSSESAEDRLRARLSEIRRLLAIKPTPT